MHEHMSNYLKRLEKGGVDIMSAKAISKVISVGAKNDRNNKEQNVEQQ